MRRFNLAGASLGAMLVLSLLLVGCFQSKYPLGPPQPGKVDLRYVGDWILETRNDQGQTETSELIVRNLHNDEYYIEWTADEKPFRGTAYLTEINGVTFANMLPLTDEGKIAGEHTILRVDWDGPKIKIRNLNDEFFKEKKFDSSDALRKIVEENLNNDEMYKGEPFVGTKTGNL